jgi:hypothetical protein
VEVVDLDLMDRGYAAQGTYGSALDGRIGKCPEMPLVVDLQELGRDRFLMWRIN